MTEPNAHPHESRDTIDVKPITLRIREACRITGIGRSKLYELIKAGEIEVIKLGTMTLVSMRSVEEMIERAKARDGAR
ncbi:MULTISPECIES: helix-turn-helix domain-containing protein [unclassified Sphingomonas]|uniref:helix-turn-helix domain-containing protein n=1 Tax=unclassified Sphingomonas TaxID=196159 RepID=UPI00082C98C7|nr:MULTISPECIES: helix-turn-helix domain-containing protein [unclassified Sphingomonas]